MRPVRVRQPRRGGGRITGDGDIDIGHRAAEQRVAQPAADDPGRIAHGLERRAQARETHPTYTRGRRWVIPHVIS